MPVRVHTSIVCMHILYYLLSIYIRIMLQWEHSVKVSAWCTYSCTAYSNRACWEHLVHEQYRRLWNDYMQLIKCTKQEFWVTWLEEVDEHSVWTANHVTSGPSSDGGRAHIPALKGKGMNGELIEVRENSAKSKLLYEGFFPPADTSNTNTLNPDYC